MPNELDAMWRAEIERWAGVIKRAGIKLDTGLMAPRIAFSNAMLGI